MGRNVVLSLDPVLEQDVAIADQLNEETIQIVSHVQVDVLLHKQSCRGVAQEERQQAFPDAAFRKAVRAADFDVCIANAEQMSNWRSQRVFQDSERWLDVLFFHTGIAQQQAAARGAAQVIA
jgi:hypothetical protein